MLSYMFLILLPLLHSRWFIQIYFLFWKSSVFRSPPLICLVVLIVYCSLLMFLIYFLKHFKHTLVALIISFFKNPDKYAICYFAYFFFL